MVNNHIADLGIFQYCKIQNATFQNCKNCIVLLMFRIHVSTTEMSALGGGSFHVLMVMSTTLCANSRTLPFGVRRMNLAGALPRADGKRMEPKKPEVSPSALQSVTSAFSDASRFLLAAALSTCTFCVAPFHLAPAVLSALVVMKTAWAHKHTQPRRRARPRAAADGALVDDRSRSQSHRWTNVQTRSIDPFQELSQSYRIYTCDVRPYRARRALAAATYYSCTFAADPS